MNDKTVELVSLALDAAVMRQTAIATNIANVNTQGYKTIGVNFEQQLGEGKLSQPVYQVEAQPSSIDDQVALSVKNATHYRALIKGLNHHLAIMQLALHGNKES